MSLTKSCDSILFKPRGMPFVDYDDLLDCLRADAIQVLSKRVEILRERNTSQQEAEVSDVSSLTSLGTTPELSDVDMDLPSKSGTTANPGKASNKGGYQLRSKPEDGLKSGAFGEGKPGLASKTLARKSTKQRSYSAYAAEQVRRSGLLRHLLNHETLADCKTAIQFTDEAVVSPSPAPRSNATQPARKHATLVPPRTEPDEWLALDRRLREISEKDIMNAHKPESTGPGGRDTAQTPQETTVGNQTVGIATTDESAGLYLESIMRSSWAGSSDSRNQSVQGNVSSPPYRGTKQLHGAQQPHGSQQPHVDQNAAAIQGFWRQQYVNSVLPLLPAETIQDLTQSSGDPSFEGAAAVLSRPRLPAHSGWQHRVPDMPELHQSLNQLPQLGSQPSSPQGLSQMESHQSPYDPSQYPQTPTRPPRLRPQQLAHGLPQTPGTPTQPSQFRSQQPPRGLAQLPRATTRSPSPSDLPRPRRTTAKQPRFGMPWPPQTTAPPPRPGSPQLAHSQPQVPSQTPPGSLQDAQYPQGFGQPRGEAQNLASLREALRVSQVDDDEQDDLQYSSRDAWQSSNRKRKAPRGR